MAQLHRVLDGTRSWLLTAHNIEADLHAAAAEVALAELGDPELAHDAALSLLDLCWPALDGEYPPEIPPEWWASPLGRAISRAMARDDDLSLLRIMGPRAAGVDQVVASARLRGASWEQIAQALGMTRQSAWERWAGSSQAT